jgi:hypothetical protein
MILIMYPDLGENLPRSITLNPIQGLGLATNAHCAIVPSTFEKLGSGRAAEFAVKQIANFFGKILLTIPIKEILKLVPISTSMGMSVLTITIFF